MLTIINGKIITARGNNIENGYIETKDGVITGIGAMDGFVPQEGGEVIDAGGMYVLPGFIDPHDHIGLFGDGLGFEGDDGNEATDPVTPSLRAIDGINHADRCFAEAVEGGVTCVVTGPGSANVIGGQFAALKTYGRTVDEMILRLPAR
jgi:imidazolonepropionase-like amidohydrolase